MANQWQHLPPLPPSPPIYQYETTINNSSTTPLSSNSVNSCCHGTTKGQAVTTNPTENSASAPAVAPKHTQEYDVPQDDKTDGSNGESPLAGHNIMDARGRWGRGHVIGWYGGW